MKCCTLSEWGVYLSVFYFFPHPTMGTSFSPAPWTQDNELFLQIHSNGKLIATCHNRVSDPPSSATPSEAEANARLIAAAPELLIELKKAMTLLNTLDKSNWHDDDIKETISVMFTGNAAIDKSESRA